MLIDRWLTRTIAYKPMRQRKLRAFDIVIFSGGYRGGHAPLEANIPTLPLQKFVESKAGKRDFKNTQFLVFLKFL